MGPFLIIKAPIVGFSGDAGCFKAKKGSLIMVPFQTSTETQESSPVLIPVVPLNSGSLEGTRISWKAGPIIPEP